MKPSKIKPNHIYIYIYNENNSYVASLRRKTSPSMEDVKFYLPTPPLGKDIRQGQF